MSASSGETGPELTLTEKVVARLYRTKKEELASGKYFLMYLFIYLLFYLFIYSATTLWCNPVLNYTTENIQEPLVSLPSTTLTLEAVQLFKVKMKTFIIEFKYMYHTCNCELGCHVMSLCL